MREDDEEFRHYVPLLRRIIILVAVITAVPSAGIDGLDQRAGRYGDP